MEIINTAKVEEYKYSSSSSQDTNSDDEIETNTIINDINNSPFDELFMKDLLGNLTYEDDKLTIVKPYFIINDLKISSVQQSNSTLKDINDKPLKTDLQHEIYIIMILPKAFPNQNESLKYQKVKKNMIPSLTSFGIDLKIRKKYKPKFLLCFINDPHGQVFPIEMKTSNEKRKSDDEKEENSSKKHKRSTNEKRKSEDEKLDRELEKIAIGKRKSEDNELGKKDTLKKINKEFLLVEKSLLAIKNLINLYDD